MKGLSYSPYQVPWLIRLLTSPWLLWEVSGTEKTIFLTFDDGPDPDVTPQVLDMLRGFGAKATFFLTGNKASHETDLVRQLLKEGHAIGNHTHDHLNGYKVSSKTYLDNINACARHVSSALFRPPYGKIRPAQLVRLKQKGYQVVMWTVLSNDFNAGLDRDACLRNTIKYTRNGAIVVFHDTKKAASNCLYVLPRLLDHFHKRGFAFKSLDLGVRSGEIK